MPINLTARECQFIRKLPFTVCKDKIKYLGVWVTHKFKDLFSALLSSLKEDIDRWDLLPLSLAGRINTVKMSILPKFLYLFQCIPVFLTKTFFISLDRKFSSFIWNKKNARIHKAILQRPHQQRGLSLPNFQLYYWAANIEIISYWIGRNEARDSCNNTSLSALYTLVCHIQSLSLNILLTQSLFIH